MDLDESSSLDTDTKGKSAGGLQPSSFRPQSGFFKYRPAYYNATRANKERTRTNDLLLKSCPHLQLVAGICFLCQRKMLSERQSLDTASDGRPFRDDSTIHSPKRCDKKPQKDPRKDTLASKDSVEAECTETSRSSARRADNDKQPLHHPVEDKGSRSNGSRVGRPSATIRSVEDFFV